MTADTDLKTSDHAPVPEKHERFVLLDGLRGIAALFVMTRHTDLFWNGSPFWRSYLAVDIFFIMSGFVIGFAYDARLRSGAMSFRDFAVTRIIRLYPMYALALLLNVLAFAALVAQGGAGFGYDALLTSAALTALFLPSMLPGKPELFPLNGPFWSLFFELIANFIYGALVRVLSTKAILGIMAFAALVSLPGARVWGSFDTGFTWGALSIASGWGRATFGVFAGLLLFRHRAGLSLWLRGAIGPLFNPWLGLALLCAILASPPLIAYNWLLDAALVFGLFPMITLMCSAPIHARWSTLMLGLGAISYPLYVLHRVVARIIEQVVEKLAGPEILTQIAPFGGIALIAFLAVLCLWLEKVFDIPLRKRLRARFLPARTKPAQAAPAE